MKLLEGKVALITGAARGIGKAIALKFASEGCDIAFTDLVIDENGKKTEEEIAAFGVKAKGYASNAADFEACHNVVAEVVKDFGRLDILVNNAGITKDGLMMRMSEAQWDAVIGVNLKSAFNFVHAVTPVMMRQRTGSIINMASVVGVHGNAGQANYSASKAGMIGLAKSVAQELGSRGIRANAIAPGFIITDMTAKLSDEIKEEWCKKIPLRRGGTPEDVANIATFLASDMSSYVSGQVIQAGPARIQVLNQAYKMNNDFVNNSSVAYMVSLNGTNTVFLGDLAKSGGEQLMADHDLSALKCDIVQVAHHGQNGVGYEVYKALRPSVALWPTPQWLWDNDNGGGAGSGIWLTQETKNWMVRLGVNANYCIKDGDQVIE